MPHPPKVDDVDYIQFLIAAQKVYTCTEAASCQPGIKPPQAPSQAAAAHDAFTRLLARRPPDTEALWHEVQAFVDQHGGMLLLDDTTLDKPYARKIELVTRHWSGKHRAVVSGINLLSLLWTDGVGALPCDCRVYDKPLPEGKTKNEHFQTMLKTAKARGLAPALVGFDSWYSGLDNLHYRRDLTVLVAPHRTPAGPATCSPRHARAWPKTAEGRARIAQSNRRRRLVRLVLISSRSKLC